MKSIKPFWKIKFTGSVSSILFFLLPFSLFAQVETVPLQADFHAANVYDFLKEMRVKKIITDFRDDNLTLSRAEIIRLLEEVQKNWQNLSEVEKKLTKRFQMTFENPEKHENEYTYFFGTLERPSDHFKEIFGDKEKLLFYAFDDENRLFIETFGQLDFTHDMNSDRSFVAQGGFRFRGSIFNNFGYNLSFIKGATLGNRQTMLLSRPDLRYNYKYIENIDGTPSIDFTDGYLRYQSEPKEKVLIYAQLGREKIKYGLGYSASLTLSGNHTDLDAIRFGINYKQISFSSIHASTSGNFFDTLRNVLPRADRYTKYFSAQRLRLHFPDLFAVGIGAIAIHHGRFDFAYLNPFQFYKFAEHSLQDRDNAAMFFDFQTHFLKNVELQASLFLDENLDFSNADSERNKYAYQVGFFWYEFLTLKNLSFVAEYTRVRPYTYTHFDERNSYSAWGVGLGHPIGSNADEVFLKLTYNLTDWMRPYVEFRKRRRGNNILDENGFLVRNVGGDLLRSYETNDVNPIAPFLDGERIETDLISINVRIEPIRNWVVEASYRLQREVSVAKNSVLNQNFVYLRVTAEY